LRIYLYSEIYYFDRVEDLVLTGHGKTAGAVASYKALVAAVTTATAEFSRVAVYTARSRGGEVTGHDVGVAAGHSHYIHSLASIPNTTVSSVRRHLIHIMMCHVITKKDNYIFFIFSDVNSR
jgi:cobalamin biosynthesis Co2+ chelatase CbiK